MAIAIILFLLIAASFAYFRLASKVWWPCLGLLLAIYGFLGWFANGVALLCGVIWLGLGLFLFITPLRRFAITKPVQKWFAKQQPQITAAEQTVLDAGGVWWEQEIFNAEPDWDKLCDLKQIELTNAEQAYIDQQVETLCGMLDEWDIVHKRKDLPPDVWDYIKKEKFWGLVISQEFEGLGFSAVAHSAIVSKIASRSISAAFTIMVPNSLGPAEFLVQFGTEQQKQYYLPRLAKGEETPCFALTAPQAGSDATSIVDKGVVCREVFDGQEVIGIRLNWNKRYITLGPVATLIGLAFRCYDPDHLLGDVDDLGITLALIPNKTPGIQQGERHNPLHLAFMNGPVRGQNVFIPLDYVIGGRAGVGCGWQMMMECLAVGRGISLPALSAAVGKFCLRMTADYAIVREQFNRSIGEFEGIQAAIARQAGFTLICEAVRSFTANAVECGARPSVASAISKYHLTELARRIVQAAMDVHAGRGIQIGPSNYLSNIYNAIPTIVTVEGANILTRNLIIFGQGIVRCHPYLRAEILAAKDSLADFDRLLMQHAGFIACRWARALWYGLTGGKWIQISGNDLFVKYARQFTRMSNAFMLVTDMTLAALGGKLKIKEFLSARLGDVVSHIYLGAAVLKHYHANGSQPQDEPVVCWALDYCLAQIQQYLDRVLTNFPYRWLGCFMRWWIFPWGTSYRWPRDNITKRVAELMQQDRQVRDRFANYCYIGKSVQDPSGCMDLAYLAIQQQGDAIKKVTDYLRTGNLGDGLSFSEQAVRAHAAGALTEAELQALIKMDELRQHAIAVDEF